MKNIIIFILLSTAIWAEKDEEFSFVGLGISTQSIDISPTDIDKNTFAIKYGKQSIDYRTTFAFNYNKNYQSLSMDIDKILVNEMFGTPKLRPYLGFSVGTLKLLDTGLSDESGYYYGANAGIIIYATDNVDVDLSYHYNIVQEIKDADNIHGISFALHYFF